VLTGIPFTAPSGLDTADFDADGHLDLVIQYTHLQIKPGGVVVAFGRGDGSFDPPIVVFAFPLGPFVEGVHSARAGDINGDGLPDIVVTSQPSRRSSCPTATARSPTCPAAVATASPTPSSWPT
jgi:hypothetical protein